MSLKVGNASVSAPYSKMYVGTALVYEAVSAYTFDDLLVYCQKISDGQIGSGYFTKLGAQYILANKQAIRNATDVTQFTNFLMSATSSTVYLTMTAQNMNINLVSPGSNNYKVSGFTTPNFDCKLEYGGISSVHNNLTNIQQLAPNAFTTNITQSFGLITSGTLNTEGKGYFNLI